MAVETEQGDDTRRAGPVWGHVALVLGMVGYCEWYLYDAYRVNRGIGNLILILPGALIALGIGIALLVFEFGFLTDKRTDDSAPARQPLILMAVLVGYLLIIPYVGFDVATFMFIATTVILLGERRPWVTLAFSIGFTAPLMIGLRAISDIPVPAYWPF